MNPDAPLLGSLYLYLSERCNLRCRHCWVAPAPPGAGTEKLVDFAVLTEAVIRAKELGLGTVKLTGGEPFLRGDIVALLRFLQREDLIVYIESNGTMIDADMARVIGECGVRQVSISLDAARADQHDRLRGSPGAHALAVEALRLLGAEGVVRQVIMSLYEENVAEIEPLAALCDDLGAPSLKINPIMPTGRGKMVFQRGENLAIEELIRIDRWIDAELNDEYKTDISLSMPIGLKSLERITGAPLYECRILNIMGILADGTVSICGIGQTETELNMGNIATDDIRELWRCHPILRRLREDIPSRLAGVCGRCIFKFRCLGSCRACAYAADGDLGSPFFMCREAEHKNLFPPSRLYGPPGGGAPP